MIQGRYNSTVEGRIHNFPHIEKSITFYGVMMENLNSFNASHQEQLQACAQLSILKTLQYDLFATLVTCSVLVLSRRY